MHTRYPPRHPAVPGPPGWTVSRGAGGLPVPPFGGAGPPAMPPQPGANGHPHDNPQPVTEPPEAGVPNGLRVGCFGGQSARFRGTTGLSTLPRAACSPVCRLLQVTANRGSVPPDGSQRPRVHPGTTPPDGVRQPGATFPAPGSSAPLARDGRPGRHPPALVATCSAPCQSDEGCAPYGPSRSRLIGPPPATGGAAGRGGGRSSGARQSVRPVSLYAPHGPWRAVRGATLGRRQMRRSHGP